MLNDYWVNKLIQYHNIKLQYRTLNLRLIHMGEDEKNKLSKKGTFDGVKLSSLILQAICI